VTEAILVVLAGAGLGLLLAWWATGVVRATAPGGVCRESVRSRSMRGCWLHGADFSSGHSGDRHRASRASSNARSFQPLKAGSPGAAGSGLWPRLRSSLVALEVALALVLLIATGLLVRSLWTLNHVNPGFDPQGVVTFAVFPPPAV